MGSIWAVARHTFAQCLRMKIAVAFIILLAVVLGTMPFVMKGDGTLAGQIRTFLSYGTSITSVLLTLVTIFVACGVVSFDVRDKQVFTVATKPIARWQYILGRWAGLVMLDALLLAVAGSAIYGFAQYLRRGPETSAIDRRAVESEVFAARNQVRPDEPDIQDELQRRIARFVDQNRYQDAVESYKVKTGGDEEAARKLLEEEIQKEILQARQSAAPVDPNDPYRNVNDPRGQIVWRFSGVRLEAGEVTGAGRIAELFPGVLQARVEADPHLISNLILRGPVQVNGLSAAVVRMEMDYFDVQFFAQDLRRQELTGLTEGQEVRIVIEPTIQITYKPSAGSDVTDGMLRSRWIVEDANSQLLYKEDRTDPVRIASTITVPARAVARDGRMVLRYVNFSPASVTILNRDISVLYRVGGFEMNFVRGLMLILLQLAFIAGVGVLAGSFLSFPVACMVCFSILPFSVARAFLAEAVRPPVDPARDTDAFVIMGRYIFYGMKVIMPDLERTSPADQLVGGRHISWLFLGETAFWTVCVSTAAVLGLACLIFHRRELARVQV